MDPPEFICREPVWFGRGLSGQSRKPPAGSPFFLCQRTAHRPVRVCTTSHPACRGCLRFGPARFDIMCLRMRSAQSGPALRAARRFCRRAYGLCAPYVHLRLAPFAAAPGLSIARPARL